MFPKPFIWWKHLQQLLTRLFSFTLESTRRYNWRENEAHIYLPHNLWLLWRWMHLYRHVCISPNLQTCLNFSLLLQSAEISQPFIVIALISQRGQTWMWLCFTAAAKWRGRNQNSPLVFSVLHLGRPMNSNSKTIWKHTWDFCVCLQQQTAVLPYL